MLITRLFSSLFIWKSSGGNHNNHTLTMDLEPGNLDTTTVQQSPSRHKLYIAIPSMIEDEQKRDAIRDTWAQSATQHHLPLHFYLGTSNCSKVNGRVSTESTQHKDIIMTRYEDLWNNKVRKLFDAMQRAVYGEQTSSDYFMFVEDTTFVQVPAVLKWLDEHGTSKLYGGRVNYNNTPVRNPTSIYYISESSLPDHKFPPYCESVGWVMGRETVVALLAQRDTRLMLHIDDVTVGCWLERMAKEGKFKADIVNVGVQGIGPGGDLMVTGQTPHDMRRLWQSHDETIKMEF